MAQSTYDLGNLVPELSRVLQGDFTSAEGLSAHFVAVLFIIAGIFTLSSVWSFLRALIRISFYKSLIKNLEVEQLLEKRRDINNQAKKSNRYGKLWREFDESLVEVSSRQRLCNTLDAEHFFNTHTLASGLTENRLLAAVPGFLTAVGVIGTFAGLQMGLSSLSSNMGVSPQIDELKVGIFSMIGGASIAFMTSVWGVLTSVIFNLFEKLLERWIRSSISSFQNQVDYLYPRITAEHTLSNIEGSSQQSAETLQGLAEKIGDRLQEVLVQATDNIRDGMENSLHSILGPAIEKLVDNAHSGSEKALESLVDRFMAGVGSAGDAQEQMMQSAAQEVGKASESMTRGMEGFVTKLESQIEHLVVQSADTITGVQHSLTEQLDSQQKRTAERDQVFQTKIMEYQSTQEQMMQKTVKDVGSASESMSHGLNGFVEKMQTQIDSLVMQSAKTLVDVQSSLAGRLDEQQQREAERDQVFQRKAMEYQENQEDLMQRTAQEFGMASESMGQGLNGFVDKLESQVANLVTQNANAMTNVQGTLSGQIEAQQQREVERDQIFQDKISSYQSTQQHLESGISAMMATQKQQHSGINVGLASLLREFDGLSSSNQQVSTAMQKSAEDMRATSNQLGILSTNLKSAVDKLGSDVGGAVEQVNEISKQNLETVQFYQSVAEQIQLLNGRLETTAETMNSAAAKAESGLTAVDKHFEQLTQSLSNHVEQLEEQVSKLLGDYSERVQSQTVDRLNVWNQQTNAYTGAMTDAVRALSDVVSEIDDKMSTVA